MIKQTKYPKTKRFGSHEVYISEKLDGSNLGIGFKDVEHYKRFEFAEPLKLELTMQDLLLDNAKYGSVISKNGDLFVDKSKGGEKHEL